MSENVTRGGGQLNPTKYKNDVLTQAWVDSRVLATLLVWLEELGQRPRTMSVIVRDPLNALCKHLVDNGEVKMIEDTIVARQLLEKRTGVDLSRGGRGGKNVLHNVVLTSRRGEVGERVGEQVENVNVPLGDGSIYQDPRVAEAIELYKKSMENEDSS